MRLQLCCETPTRNINLGWISFQPDFSISFGLNDRTFIASKFKARHFVWNAYNRQRINYHVISDSDALEAVQNPHFTYHPEAWFHLKGNSPDADGALFEAIADLPLMLEQDGEMPWIKAYSANVASLNQSGSRANVAVDQFALRVPTEHVSICMQLDFVRPGIWSGMDHQSRKYLTWGKVGLRVGMSFSMPRSPSLSWFHFQ